ncbi:MAG: sigma-54-dependent Fis family transcriptional regulator [Opitutaceae bacterium]|nr:sigma-54-dependent Fis family transcriptional regulator [Opitutaceae bacterium]
MSRRLKAAGGSFSCRVRAQVDPLDAATAGRVCLCPFALLQTPAWPARRTQLAQASRYFIVYGTGLATAQVIAACRDGAFDVLDSQDTPQRWAEACQAAAEAQRLWLQLYGAAPSETGDGMIGAGEAVLALRRAIERIGPTRTTVLITGESGVGKERVAQALHDTTREGQFIALNCAAVPPELLESELFGVVKGAFTGASADRPGLVEQAAGGTLFLDEIGELEPALQAKLLRFLETRRARRLGSNKEYAVDLRLLSATNRDLEAESAAGRFRSDLYYRLAEVTLRVPPLRQRREDIPLLARHFLAQACTRFGKFFDAIEPALLQRMQGYDWPGNVRELKSVVDRLVLLFDGPVLRAGWWEPPVPIAPPAPATVAPAPPVTGGLPRLPSRRERRLLAERLLAEGHHDLTWIAAQAGVHPSTLFRWRQSGRLLGSGPSAAPSSPS